MSALDPEMAKALEPWNGEWFVPLPKPGLRFVSLDQYTAKQLLMHHSELSNWEAHVCQIVMTQPDPPSSLQRHYLNRMAARVGRRAA